MCAQSISRLEQIVIVRQWTHWNLDCQSGLRSQDSGRLTDSDKRRLGNLTMTQSDTMWCTNPNGRGPIILHKCSTAQATHNAYKLLDNRYHSVQHSVQHNKKHESNFTMFTYDIIDAVYDINHLKSSPIGMIDILGAFVLA